MRCANITGRISTARLRAVLRAARRRNATQRGRDDGRRAARGAAGASAAAAELAAAGRRREPAGRAMPYVVASQQLAASPCMRGQRTAVPRREALILQAAAQPSLAAARPSGGTCRARIPPCRRRAAQARADRSSLAHDRRRRCARRCGRNSAAGATLAEAMERIAAVDHDHLGLGRAAGRRRRRTFW